MLDELILRFEFYPPSSPTLSVYGKTGKLACYVGIDAVSKYADLTCQDTDDVLKEMGCEKLTNDTKVTKRPNRCIDCAYYNKKAIGPITETSPFIWGSCRKLNEDIVTSNIWNQVKANCPLKGDEE